MFQCRLILEVVVRRHASLPASGNDVIFPHFSVSEAAIFYYLYLILPLMFWIWNSARRPLNYLHSLNRGILCGLKFCCSDHLTPFWTSPVANPEPQAYVCLLFFSELNLVTQPHQRYSEIRYHKSDMSTKSDCLKLILMAGPFSLLFHVRFTSNKSLRNFPKQITWFRISKLTSQGKLGEKVATVSQLTHIIFTFITCLFSTSASIANLTLHVLFSRGNLQFQQPFQVQKWWNTLAYYQLVFYHSAQRNFCKAV